MPENVFFPFFEVHPALLLHKSAGDQQPLARLAVCFARRWRGLRCRSGIRHHIKLFIDAWCQYKSALVWFSLKKNNVARQWHVRNSERLFSSLPFLISVSSLGISALWVREHLLVSLVESGLLLSWMRRARRDGSCNCQTVAAALKVGWLVPTPRTNAPLCHTAHTRRRPDDTSLLVRSRRRRSTDRPSALSSSSSSSSRPATTGASAYAQAHPHITRGGDVGSQDHSALGWWRSSACGRRKPHVASRMEGETAS